MQKLLGGLVVALAASGWSACNKDESSDSGSDTACDVTDALSLDGDSEVDPCAEAKPKSKKQPKKNKGKNPAYQPVSEGDDDDDSSEVVVVDTGDDDDDDGDLYTPNDASDLSAVVMSSSKVTLTWSPNAEGSYYVIAYAAGAEAPSACDAGSVIGSDMIGDGTTYTIDGLPYAFQYTFRICAEQDGVLSPGVSVTTDPGSLGFDFVSEDELAQFSVSGDGTYDLVDGGGLVTSDLIDGQMTCIARTFYTATDQRLTFDWSVSSEQRYDPHTFSVDGTKVDEISGRLTSMAVGAGFARSAYELAGEVSHVLQWCYAKDGSVSYFDDNARLRNLRFEELSTAPDNTLGEVTAITPFSATVSWDPDRSAGDVIDTHTIEVNDYSTCGFGDPVGQGTGGTASISGLVGGTNYVIAVCSKPTDQFDGFVRTTFLTFTTPVDPLTANMGFESGSLANWSTGYYYLTPWGTEGTVVHDGANAATSLNTTAYSYGCFRRAVDTSGGARDLSFWWKVSSHVEHTLTFYIDGMDQGAISGDIDWEQKTFTIPAGDNHVVSWCYQLNGTAPALDNKAYVDSVSITP